MEQELDSFTRLKKAFDEFGRAFLEGFQKGFFELSAIMKPAIAEFLNRIQNDPEYAERYFRKERHRRRYYRMMERMKKGK